MKSWKVYTYYTPEMGNLCRTNIIVLTMWSNEEWPGCEVFHVNAESGREARRVAKERRFQMERNRGEGSTLDVLGL